MTSPLILKAIRVDWTKDRDPSAPTTSENIVFTIIDALGAEFNTTVYTLDPSNDSTTDVLLTDINVPTFPGDKIQATYANTDGNNVAIQVIYANRWS